MAGDHSHRRLAQAREGNSSGFTLIELLVVISIVSLLVAIMAPSLGRVREDARRTVCVANLKGIGVGLFSYSSENHDFAPPVMSPMGNRAPRSLVARSGEPVNLGLLVSQAVDNPEVFLCPSQRKFNYSPNVEDLNRDTVAGSYAYAVNKPASESPRFGAIRHLALVADDFVARYGDVGVGRYSHRAGYNVLYTDGSASWWADQDESVWQRKVYWDDESDEVTYQTLYGLPQGGGVNNEEDEYGYKLDIFRVWHAFCYSRPDEYGDALPH